MFVNTNFGIYLNTYFQSMKKIKKIFIISLPILVMIALITAIENDYILAFIYAVIISWSLQIMKAGRKDYLVLVFGMVAMTIFEYIFVSTGVETFARNSLLGLMPLWLPLLWGYGFVAIKRSADYLG
jgi:hypothetical protein